MSFQTVIGLEVHAQLNTKSKLFSGQATTFGAAANTQTSFVDAGLPGVLPVLNQQAVNMAIQFGLAINATINDLSYFERKNYFYPDLPKGYQISQFQRPIVGMGSLLIDGNKTVTIIRAHLEEDAGKSIHDLYPHETGIDLNRAGTPLLEIVTSPCLYSASEAIVYLKTLHQLLRFLDICDGNMQEGSFRCDVNLSLRPEGSDTLGVRTELKNLNSFRFIEKAIHVEQERHREMLSNGEKIAQETRLYCPNTNKTEVIRLKENENDYRYFPDPDLLPIKISDNTLKQIKASMPILPSVIQKALRENDALKDDDIDFLLTTPAHVGFYHKVKTITSASPLSIVNWLKGPYSALLNEQNCTFSAPPVSAKIIAKLLKLLDDKNLSSKLAKNIMFDLVTTNKSFEELVAQINFKPETDNDKIKAIALATIQKHPEQVKDFHSGKEKILSFFIGQVMKETKGQGSPETINAIVRELLKNN
jgi:aspartyl-tRNA(Asn)/glutamyl-tRNA(Gln) amidotransferase subunit B